MADKKMFEEVSSSPWVSVIYSLSLVFMLFFLAKSAGRPIDPIFMYLLSGLILVVFGVNNTKFSKIKKVFGFKGYFPGFNIMLGVMGAGLAFILYGIIVKNASMIFHGKDALQVALPFYLPYRLTGVSFTLSHALHVVVPLMLVVAVIEESGKIIVFKNIANWLDIKDIKKNYALILGVVVSLVSWGLFHYWARGGLSFGMILSISGYGVLFWATYYLPSSLNLIKEKRPNKGVLLTGAIVAHFVWNVLVSVPTSAIPVSSMALTGIGMGMFTSSMLGMWVVRNAFARRMVGEEIFPEISGGVMME